MNLISVEQINGPNIIDEESLIITEKRQFKICVNVNDGKSRFPFGKQIGDLKFGNKLILNVFLLSTVFCISQCHVG